MLIVTYALALWLGLYLLRLGTWDAGAGLVVYALGLALVGLPGWWIATAVVPAVFWLLSIWRLGRRLAHTPRRERWLLVAASIFLTLSLGSLLLPRLPRDVALLAVGTDLLLVGYVVAVLDADNVGEVFLPAALRSLVAAALVAVIFGGQVGFAIIIEGPSPTLRLLLVQVIAVSIALAVFAAPINNRLDRLLLPVRVGQTRATLRAVGEGLPRTADDLDPVAMDDETFAKHTRRALSALNKPDKLAASPLMRLPELESESPLERVTELRALLIERIQRLKPTGSDGYGTGDEWRYYNALYYPYVLGVRPFSRRTTIDQPDDELRTVLAWFQTQVPERTLYNWQTAAAALIARDLRA
ncbi:MAG: hypothetical protein GYB65_15890 [Chloroflexi bacterium]|nr:hypothetical protein [Chloroflexota bacterium]